MTRTLLAATLMIIATLATACGTGAEGDEDNTEDVAPQGEDSLGSACDCSDGGASGHVGTRRQERVRL